METLKIVNDEWKTFFYDMKNLWNAFALASFQYPLSYGDRLVNWNEIIVTLTDQLMNSDTHHGVGGSCEGGESSSNERWSYSEYQYWCSCKVQRKMKLSFYLSIVRVAVSTGKYDWVECSLCWRGSMQWTGLLCDVLIEFSSWFKCSGNICDITVTQGSSFV